MYVSMYIFTHIYIYVCQTRKNEVHTSGGGGLGFDVLVEASFSCLQYDVSGEFAIERILPRQSSKQQLAESPESCHRILDLLQKNDTPIRHRPGRYMPTDMSIVDKNAFTSSTPNKQDFVAQNWNMCIQRVHMTKESRRSP